MRYKVRKHLEKEGKEYTADNVILALWDMNYIDLDKIYSKKEVEYETVVEDNVTLKTKPVKEYKIKVHIDKVEKGML